MLYVSFMHMVRFPALGLKNNWVTLVEIQEFIIQDRTVFSLQIFLLRREIFYFRSQEVDRILHPQVELLFSKPVAYPGRFQELNG